ncbi:MAG: hypothetical protein H7287_01625 [Thermoleophilia bacterium]|nr:hypothetical protein [Thermoleophilia bacterium]
MCAVVACVVASPGVAHAATPQLYMEQTASGRTSEVSVRVAPVTAVTAPFYELVQHTYDQPDFHWKCRYASFDRLGPGCSLTYDACYRSPCTPTPRTYDATSFDLLDTRTNTVVASADVLSVQVRVDRAADVVVGRVTPSLDYSVIVTPASGDPQVTQLVHADDSGYLRASFDASSSTPFDIHVRDAVRIVRSAPDGSSFRVNIPQLRMLVELGSSTLLLDGQSEGYYNVSLYAPDGTRRGPVARSYGSYAALPAEPNPGDRIAVEDNGGVRIDDIVVPTLDAELEFGTKRIHGRFLPPAGRSAVGYVVTSDWATLDKHAPTADNRITVAPNGSFSQTTPASGRYGYFHAFLSYPNNPSASVEATDPNDNMVRRSAGLANFTLDLDTGWINAPATRARQPRTNPEPIDDVCPVVLVDDDRAPAKLDYASDYCVQRLLPVPSAGSHIRVVDRATGRLLGAGTVPRMSMSADEATRDVSVSWDPSVATDPYAFQVAPAWEGLVWRYSGMGNAYGWSANWDSCVTVGACTARLPNELDPGDLVRATVSNLDSPGASYVRNVSFETPFELRYDALSGNLTTTFPTAGTWRVQVQSPAGVLVGSVRTITRITNQRFDVDLTDASGKPLASNGDTIFVIAVGSTAKHAQMVVQAPIVQVDQQTGRALGTLPASAMLGVGTLRSGRFDGPVVTPDAQRHVAIDEVAPGCGKHWLTWRNEDGHETASADLRWCYEARSYADARYYLKVGGGAFSARRVIAMRGAVVLVDAALARTGATLLGAGQLAGPLLPGDTVRIEGTTGSVETKIPLYEGIRDTGGDRVIIRTDPALSVTLWARPAGADGPYEAYERTPRADGRVVVQFGEHGPDPLDIVEAPTQLLHAVAFGANVVFARALPMRITVDLAAGRTSYAALPPGGYRERIACGTSLETVNFDAPAGTATIEASRFTRLGLHEGCTLVTDDATKEELGAAEVPTLDAEIDPTTRAIRVTTEPGATIAVTRPDGSSGELTADAAGVLDLPAPTGSAAVRLWLSLRDRHLVVWRRPVDIPEARPAASTPVATLPTTPSPTAPPAAAGTAPIHASGAKIADPSGVSVTVPPGAFTGALLRVDPNVNLMDRVAAATIKSRGFAAGSLFVDVDITDAGGLGSDIDVHGLVVPIRVVVPVPASNVFPDSQLAPAWFSGGKWKLSPKITPGILPRELSDGYWVQQGADGGRVVIFLTRHLTEFGVLRDVTAPAWKGRVSVFSNTTATASTRIAWRAATDGASAVTYRIRVDGQLRARGATAPRAIVIVGNPATPHRVCVYAVDASANMSSQCLYTGGRSARGR